MGLISCPHCLKQIYDGVEACPHCGGPISLETITEGEKRLKEGIHTYVLQKEKRWFIAGIIASIVTMGMFAYVFLNMGGEFSIGIWLRAIMGGVLGSAVFGCVVYFVFYVHLFFGLKRKGILRWFLFLFFTVMLTLFILFGIPAVIVTVRAIVKKVKKQPVVSEEFVIDKCT